MFEAKNRLPLAETVRGWARTRPRALAFIEATRRIDWADYDGLSDQIAARLRSLSFETGARVAVWLPDGIELHAALLAVEKAGLVALGIGARAGQREVQHLLQVAGASALISLPNHRGDSMRDIFADLATRLPALRWHLLINEYDGEEKTAPPAQPRPNTEMRLKLDDIFLLNSTSGTTGMPKCVVHDQARWSAFHDEAIAAAQLNADDIFMSVAPPPFGFGIWTSHTTPTWLGAPTVIMPNFDAGAALRLIAKYRVTVLAAVSTQFVMLLNHPDFATTDFSTLRALFTGGEHVPFARALDFEQRTGAAVLQFYGSNETGAFSKTTLNDTPEQRLRTAGRVLSSMELRLFDDAGRDVTTSGRGQPGGRGPLLSRGYYNNTQANAKLFTADGFMLMEDIVDIDADGYLSVSGRKGDFIIRGGKNISCAAVEEAAAAHSSIALSAAVGVPDPVFGEKTLLFVTLHPGATLSFEALLEDLTRRRVSKELFPEYLVVRADLPRSSGAKIAKQILREEAVAHVAALASFE